MVNKAAYAAIGVNIEWKKDVLGIWIGASESSKYWLLVLNYLKLVYTAVNEDATLQALSSLEEKFEDKYLLAIKSWRNN
ncbi:transposase [Clostridium perfringens]